MKHHVLISVALVAAGTGLAATAPEADAASTLVVKGRGFGHGVGMSQYGALGYAQHGVSYRDILAHYYTGTQLSTLPGASEVGVLLATGRTSALVTQATHAGAVALDPGKRYKAVGDGTGGTVLKDAGTGKPVAKAAGPMRLSAGGGPVKLLGPSAAGVTDGEFRGELEVRPSAAGGLSVINALDVEDYVRGVVGAESPASWPADALRAQAVAARTYALTTDAGGGAGGFTQYADTRSQVYRGVAAETAATDSAVAATSHQVVTYGGRLVTTFFFSTSGGRTENVEDSFLGSAPEPYLVSVPDPYDKVSPNHTWTMRLTLAQATAKLGPLLRGRLRAITVVKHGVSPRIVSARVVGTGGSTVVTGPALRSRLGLLDTWASFTVVTTSATRGPAPRAVPRVGGARAARVQPGRAKAMRLRGHVTGRRHPLWLQVQRGLGGGHWRTVADVQTTAAGGYAATVPGRGVYRVRTGAIVGPNVRVR